MPYSERADAAASFIIDGNEPENRDIVHFIREISGLKGSVDADVFTYRGSSLVLACPHPPLLDRLSAVRCRLKRR